MLAKAISIAAQAFENVNDKGGQPYILHCLHVMNTTQSNEEHVKVAAVLHDLLEDFPHVWSAQRLLDMGFSEDAVWLIKLLTHDSSKESYDDYIKRISHNKNATLIKLADLRHNSDITRLKDVRKKDFDRLERYALAYRYLSEV